MRYAHTVEAVRKAEGELMARLPDGTLMQRAARGLSAICARMLPRVYGSRVVLLVGSGDNGGDALYAGTILARRGAAVRAVLTGSRVHEAGLAALRAAGGRTIAVRGQEGGAPEGSAGAVGAPISEAAAEIAAADLIIDGLVGIGGRGGLREPHAAIAALASAAAAPVVAVDLPSGIDADTGTVDGTAVRADVTVTFGTHKAGLFIDPGAERAGVVEFVDIGLESELPAARVECPQTEDIARLLPAPGGDSDKYRRGVLAIAAGSARYRGAAVLTVGGALRGGIGMVRYAGQRDAVDEVLRSWPETVASVLDPLDPVNGLPNRVAAWVIGPGRGLYPAAMMELAWVLSKELPVLVDADALTLVGRNPEVVRERQAPTLLTPHTGELTRLLPGTDRADVEARRLEYATRAAEEYGCTVLLKGSTTIVAEPGRPAVVNPTGTPLLATAGSGDVLSGLIGSLLAGGLTPREAALCGAYLHGLAARVANNGAPVSASDLLEALPRAIQAVRRP
ncbi:bifunctional ADP-dependent NAD(P)H-hydrate dehydratase/NAD(P)H-hydrate epimerase [Nocardiopsis gilva YIM 90087]|uniref:Bifunctional NAD(P)H-hydrate repair enzyme n=1 Tax=Nocardiopsis gilva YIM 90087 TaxID=1235441 RepID=A0A223SC06_9ACTN|nr:bifunctional ADP-dependent NAD(P)H-hydrate dehydratase/NAD(P)H-hydrate epimerase [Nocardiopsis gilva]ASU85625.1 bifunctional ADP-dependent NAD(P)H-hydrate dehydratase/NAD(P)H-hydrate epimerase [Nocardiopsis gilva YIM 90087]